MSGSTDFRADLATSDILAAVMDRTVYLPTRGFTGVTRFSDAGHQFAGIDLEVDYGGYRWKCDEKGSVYYGVNVDNGTGMQLDTFAFEMWTTERYGDCEGHVGWFLDLDKETEAYVLVWIDRYRTIPEYSPLWYSYAMVPVVNIRNYRYGYGWSTRKLYRKAAEVMACWKANGYDGGRSATVKGDGGMFFHGQVCMKRWDIKDYYFRASTSGTTGPQFHVNLLIPRDTLMGMSISNGNFCVPSH